jgi:hypothetical protein
MDSIRCKQSYYKSMHWLTYRVPPLAPMLTPIFWPLNLNDFVNGPQQFLQRTLGERIEVQRETEAASSKAS